MRMKKLIFNQSNWLNWLKNENEEMCFLLYSGIYAWCAHFNQWESRYCISPFECCFVSWYKYISVATVIGTVLAFFIVPMRSLGADGWKIATALMGSYIGGCKLCEAILSIHFLLHCIFLDIDFVWTSSDINILICIIWGTPI